MHLHSILSQLLAAGSTTTTTTNPKASTGSSYVFFIFLAVIGLAYVLFIRPRSQRMRQQQQANRQLGVGDEVMSAGGIFGKVVALDDDAVEVEVAPGTVLTFLPRAVSLRKPPAAAPPARGGGFFAPRPARNVPAPVEPEDEPVDPWESEPDGPGDTAGESAAPGDHAGHGHGPNDGHEHGPNDGHDSGDGGIQGSPGESGPETSGD